MPQFITHISNIIGPGFHRVRRLCTCFIRDYFTVLKYVGGKQQCVHSEVLI